MPFHFEDSLYNRLKSLYNDSPQVLKTFLGPLYRMLPDNLKYGDIYSRYLLLLESSQWWSKEKIEEYQWNKTKKLLNHAYNNVPYYKMIFDERGISLKNIQNFHDFKKIPYLTKDDIRNNINLLLAKNFKISNMMRVTTGGSTGTPLQLYYQKGFTRSIENAFTIHGWKRFGYNLGDKIAVLRGDEINNNKQKVPFYIDPIKNRLMLSSYHMIEEKFKEYIKIISEFKPSFFHVYPSSLILLARYMEDNRVDPIPSLKGIIASSETLEEWQIEIFKKVFKCNVYSWYGLNEKVALAGGCEKSSYLHVFPEYSYVEFDNKKDGNTHIEDDNVCEIVGTSFCNLSMPLIRYRTMDYMIPEMGPCTCGRHHNLMKNVIGRKQSFFVDKSGSLITFTGYSKPLRHLNEKIVAYQYIQKVPGNIILNIESKDTITNNDEKKVYNIFKKIWPRFNMKIQYVPHIPRTKSGKFLYLMNFILEKNTK